MSPNSTRQQGLAAGALASCASAALLVLIATGCSSEVKSNDRSRSSAAPVVTPSDWQQVESLGGHPEVNFDFSSSPLTDDDLQAVPLLAIVAHLDLSNTKITDAGLKRLEHAAHLEVLDLRGTAVTDACLETLKKLPKLRHVDLHATAVSGTAQLEILRFVKPRAEAHNAQLMRGQKK